jgi:hypothetical protein
LDTVPADTPAWRATSCMVALIKDLPFSEECKT